MITFITRNGNEVKIGSIINYECTSSDGYSLSGRFTVNDTTIPYLLKKGIITIVSNPKKKVDNNVVIPTTIYEYVEKLAKRKNWKPAKVRRYLESIYEIYPMASISILLREIAIELDKQYKDQIENSPEIYVISTLNGGITKINKAAIKNYRNFAAFRNKRDAQIAWDIVKPLLKDAFSFKPKQ